MALSCSDIWAYFYKKRCQIIAYWQEVSADRQCCMQTRNAMMANAAATVLINSNKSLLFDELQAVEDEDDDILMA